MKWYTGKSEKKRGVYRKFSFSPLAFWFLFGYTKTDQKTNIRIGTVRTERSNEYDFFIISKSECGLRSLGLGNVFNELEDHDSKLGRLVYYAVGRCYGHCRRIPGSERSY